LFYRLLKPFLSHNLETGMFGINTAQSFLAISDKKLVQIELIPVVDLRVSLNLISTAANLASD
jgi:hypothetical protein